jgi:cytochrome c oxidase subunit I
MQSSFSPIFDTASPQAAAISELFMVVAHFHYVLFGGTFFAVFTGLYYWFPKMTGRMLSERLGKLNFWMALIGFNTAFFVQIF